MGIELQIDPSFFATHFRDSAEIAEALSSAGAKEIAKANAKGAEHLHAPYPVPLYSGELRRLDKTQVFTIHAASKAGAAINRKYGVLNE